MSNLTDRERQGFKAAIAQRDATIEALQAEIEMAGEFVTANADMGEALTDARATIGRVKVLVDGWVMLPNRQGTHWDGCHNVHSDCLVVAIRTALGTPNEAGKAPSSDSEPLTAPAGPPEPPLATGVRTVVCDDCYADRHHDCDRWNNTCACQDLAHVEVRAPRTPATAPVSKSEPLSAPAGTTEPPLVPGVRGARMAWDAEPTPGATGDVPR